MFTSKIQLRGNCQCCGRQQAVLDTGRMSKHGYTVDNGWFNGVCSGERHPPIQHDRSALDAMCVSIEEQCVQLCIVALDMEQGRSFPKMVDTGNTIWINRKPVREQIEWSQASVYQQQAQVKREVSHLRRRAELGRSFVKDMLKLADERHGGELERVVLDPAAKAINVGDTVKVYGRDVVVTRIADARAQGIGPAVNGKVIEHVFYERNGQEFKYPKRYARKV